MKRKQLEQCAWEKTPASQRRDKVELTTMRGTTTKKLAGNSREILVFDPSGDTPGTMEPWTPLWALYNDELQQRCLLGKTPKLHAPYSRTRPDYTSSIEGDPAPTPRIGGARKKGTARDHARRGAAGRYRVNFGTGEVTPQTFATQREAEQWIAAARQYGRDPVASRYFVERFDATAGWLPVRGSTSAYATKKKKSARQLDREIAEALAGKQSDTGSAFYDFLLERFPGGDVPWTWVQKILKEHGVPLPLMIGLGKEDAERYGIRQGKPADVNRLAKFLGY